MADLIGWVASVALLVTLSFQVYKQWKSGTSKGVSASFFVGQMCASTGFVVYSSLKGDPVFIVTNVLGLAAGLAGLLIVLKHRRREALSDSHPSRSDAPRSPASSREDPRWPPASSRRPLTTS